MQYFVGIDIGTTTVRCVIGSSNGEDDAAPTIAGSGSAPNLGMRKGAIVNIPDVVASIDAAVDQAERTSGHKVQSATVNVNGTHVVGLNSKGVVAVSGGNREITREELTRVLDAAAVVQLPTNREIIQVFAKNYRLDGQENIKDPLGMTGVRLEVDAHVITASTPSLRNLQKSVEGVGIHINDRVLPSVAAAQAVLTRQQRENGAAIVDLGGGTTNIAIFEEGELQHVFVIPVGSINITNDLAIGLRTDLDVAEKVKTAHGFIGKPVSSTKTIKLKVGRKDHIVKAENLEFIIRARLEELFELIDEEFGKVHRSGKLPGGVVLVGGGAKLDGLDDFAKEKLRLPVRIGTPTGFSGVADNVSTPEFTTAVGLMLHDSIMGATAHHASGGGGHAIDLGGAKDTLEDF